ncbi:hypothetical protein [Bifidobacterium longum]|uniref:Uncharacterized protein n=1 Tax=Bifidobacterium longum subsp. longum 2-2B TaxID=1161745 RepID=A0AAV3FJ14_BIFLL|nr:hypothetical protein [Bifidobacterium longum]EIJ22966.1 hypothetical protein HMPREF1315_0710 [Bifidobacterium longum subsp. longum 2-2B]
MGYMEKLAAEKKAVKALYDKGMENLTDDEATELKNRFEEAKRLQERVDLFKGVNDLNVDDVKPEAKTAPAAKTLGDLYAQELKKAGMTVIGTKAHPFGFRASSRPRPTCTWRAPARLAPDTSRSSPRST